jgi:hypothetical protein
VRGDESACMNLLVRTEETMLQETMTSILYQQKTRQNKIGFFFEQKVKPGIT